MEPPCTDITYWVFKSTFRSGYEDVADLHVCVCFLQHSSVDGFVEPPVPPTKSASRHSLPRCRNSFTLSTTDEQPHIGNYRLLKTIGKGNFAKVKLARHVLTGREVRQECYLYFIDNLDITVVFTCSTTFIPTPVMSASICLNCYMLTVRTAPYIIILVATLWAFIDNHIWKYRRVMVYGITQFYVV